MAARDEEHAMQVIEHQAGPQGSSGSAFRTTHWTVVLDAARPGTAQTQDAFACIYLGYWYPLYAYIRRRGHSPPDAEDVTQQFFLHLIEHRSLEGLRREGGKFRSFLLRSLDNFLANEWYRAQAQKRGGGAQHISIDAGAGEQRFALESHDCVTPETIFDRNWALALIDNAMNSLRAESVAAGKGALFENLRPHLQGDRLGQPYAQVAARHGLSEGAIKVAVHRLRRRYGELLREEIARTVGSAEEVEDELRHLVSAVSQ